MKRKRSSKEAVDTSPRGAGSGLCARPDRGRVRHEETTADQPDLRVRCDAEVWARMFTRQLDVRAALLDKRLKLEGDKSLFARLDRLFPPAPA